MELNISPLTLDHAPALLYSYDTGGLGLAAVDPGQSLWVEQPGIGLTTVTLPGSGDEPFTYAAAVDGALQWVVTVDGAGTPLALKDTSGNYALTFPRVSDSHAPFTATAGHRRDGGLELLVGAFDKLLAAPFVPDAGVLEVGALEVKSVPSPFMPIVSMATAAPADPAGPELISYVLTQNGVYAVTTLGEHFWQTSQVAVPAGAYLRVWFDGSRGRLGDSAGNVYALPSRTRLAPALPGGARRRGLRVPLRPDAGALPLRPVRAEAGPGRRRAGRLERAGPLRAPGAGGAAPGQRPPRPRRPGGAAGDRPRDGAAVHSPRRVPLDYAAGRLVAGGAGVGRGGSVAGAGATAA